jgi:hypothetical protein
MSESVLKSRSACLPSDDVLLANPAFAGTPKFRIRSRLEIWLRASVAGIVVFTMAIVLQWLVYNFWLQHEGLRYAGPIAGAIITMLLVQRIEANVRLQRIGEARRLEVIALMNHHIRNSLQAFVNIAGASDFAEHIMASVTRIESVLSDVATKLHPDEKRPSQV